MFLTSFSVATRARLTTAGHTLTSAWSPAEDPVRGPRPGALISHTPCRPKGTWAGCEDFGYLRVPCRANPRCKNGLKTNRERGTWCYQRAVSTPITPVNLMQTNMRVADRLGAFIATSRGFVGDLLPSVIYFLESSLRAHKVAGLVSRNF